MLIFYAFEVAHLCESEEATIFHKKMQRLFKSQDIFEIYFATVLILTHSIHPCHFHKAIEVLNERALSP